MSSKPLILAAFAIWAFVCARWYVCGIKEACDNKAPAREAIQPAAPVPDTASHITPAAPTETPAANSGKGTVSNSAATESKTATPVTPERMNNVQMERVEDRMVIHFPYKSSTKEDNAAIDSYLSDLARQLIQSGEKVRITGHTDFVGETKTNFVFGLRRANSIRDILVKKGVSKKQINCYSYGDTKPVATNDTPYGRYLNRRVEIRVGK